MPSAAALASPPPVRRAVDDEERNRKEIEEHASTKMKKDSEIRQTNKRRARAGAVALADIDPNRIGEANFELAVEEDPMETMRDAHQRGDALQK